MKLSPFLVDTVPKREDGFDGLRCSTISCRYMITKSEHRKWLDATESHEETRRAALMAIHDKISESMKCPNLST